MDLLRVSSVVLSNVFQFCPRYGQRFQEERSSQDRVRRVVDRLLRNNLVNCLRALFSVSLRGVTCRVLRVVLIFTSGRRLEGSSLFRVVVRNDSPRHLCLNDRSFHVRLFRRAVLVGKR